MGPLSETSLNICFCCFVPMCVLLFDTIPSCGAQNSLNIFVFIFVMYLVCFLFFLIFVPTCLLLFDMIQLFGVLVRPP